MAVTSFTCPKCGAKSRSSREIPAGAQIKCPGCGHVARYEPAGDSAIAEVLPASPPPRAQPPAPREPARPPRRRPEVDDDRAERRPARARRDDYDADDRPRRRPRDEDDDYDDRPRSRRRDWDEDDDRPARRRPRQKGSRLPGLIVLGVFLVALVAIVAGVLIDAWRSGQGNIVAHVPPVNAPYQSPWIQPPGAPRGFGGDINTTALRQPADDGPGAAGPLVKDVTSVFADPLMPGGKERRLIGPPPRAADAAPAAGPGREMPQAVLSRVKRATTLIRVSRSDRREGSGSGFFVDADLVMTNAHVVGMLAPGSQPPKKIEVVVDSGERDEKVCPAQVLTVDRSHDLALLRVTKPAGARLPEPLTVAGASKLIETQPVFIFGFPFGEQIGKAITVAESRVSSLRRDGEGVLERVQVNGGMHPGNSGGPVVDAAGNVIGVSVAVIRDTAINFAVPGERVSALLEGQLTGIRVGEAAPRAGEYALTVTVTASDPLKKIRAVSVDWWWGEPGAKIAAGRGATPGRAGRRTAALKPGPDGDFTAVLPLGSAPPEGQVLWLQPRQRDAAGNESYYQGLFTEVFPAAEPRPVRLT